MATFSKCLICGLLLVVCLPVLLTIVTFGFLTSFLWLPSLMAFLGLYYLLKDTRFARPLNDRFYSLFLRTFNSKLATNLWRLVYDTISSKAKPEHLLVMNYGYASLESHDGVYLEKYRNDEVVYQYQLYDYLVSKMGSLKTLQGKTMIEVGCGRGGAF
jgi:hypothetical protein